MVLGGPQRHPIVLHPSEFDAGDELIVGAANLNRVMRGWMSDARTRGSGEVPVEESRESSLTESSLPTLAQRNGPLMLPDL